MIHMQGVDIIPGRGGPLIANRAAEAETIQRSAQSKRSNYSGIPASGVTAIPPWMPSPPLNVGFVAHDTMNANRVARAAGQISTRLATMTSTLTKSALPSRPGSFAGNLPDKDNPRQSSGKTGSQAAPAASSAGEVLEKVLPDGKTHHHDWHEHTNAVVGDYRRRSPLFD